MADIKFIALHDLEAMPIEKQDEIGQDYVRNVKKARELTGDNREEQKNVAKWLYVLSVRLTKAREAGVEGSSTSLDDYWKRYAKAESKIPGHLYSLLGAAGLFIDHVCEFTETEFDKLSSNNLQKLGAIKRAAQTYDHPAVKAAIEVTKTAAHKDIAKKLQSILDSVKPPKSQTELDKEIMANLKDYLKARGNGLMFLLAGLPTLFEVVPETDRFPTYGYLACRAIESDAMMKVIGGEKAATKAVQDYLTSMAAAETPTNPPAPPAPATPPTETKTETTGAAPAAPTPTETATPQPTDMEKAVADALGAKVE